MRFTRGKNLQTMCLNIIVEHRDVFLTPKYSSDLYIDFLRRRYSQRLYELIEKNSKHPENYVGWLLSPYWRTVTLPSALKTFPDIVLKLKVVGDRITSLNLDSVTCSSDVLSAIVCCLPNVKSLILIDTHCTDDVLLLIRRMCTTLKSLNVSGCRKVTDKGLKNLCNIKSDPVGFPSLVALDISRTSVSLKSFVRILKYLPTLHTLSYDDLPIILYKLQRTIFDKSRKKEKCNIKNFFYKSTTESERNMLRSALEVCTDICPRVTCVSIRCRQINECELKSIAKFKNLTKLKILNVEEYSEEACSVSPFLALKGSMLTQLELFNLQVSVDVIAKSCIHLKYLVLNCIYYEDFDSSDTAADTLKNLVSLSVEHAGLDERFTAKSIEFLVESGSHLNELCIKFVEHFNDELAKVILTLPNLTKVDFSFTDIQPSTLLMFFNHPGIKQIIVDGCPLISFYSKDSAIQKLIHYNERGNTCSWEIDFTERNRVPLLCSEKPGLRSWHHGDDV